MPTRPGTKRNAAREREAKRRRERAQMTDAPTKAVAERRCADEGCSVVLSRYNYGNLCHRHQRERVMDGRAKVDVSDYVGIGS